MKQNTWYGFTLLIALCLMLGNSAVARTGGEGSSHEHVIKPPVKEVVLDGIRVRFRVETMLEHHRMMEQLGIPMGEMKMDMDSTHEITLALNNATTNEPITDARINLKIIRPDGSDQIKMAHWMEGMEHYGADFKMDQPGRYQVLTLFKANGEKHKAGFYYELSETSSDGHQHSSAGNQALYRCPMPSDNYFARAPGECPKCGMNLVEVDEEIKKRLYTCPMPEDDYFSHRPGKCPKCGMKLVPNK